MCLPGAGSFGEADPNSQALQQYLQRLVQQEAQVRALIARERQVAAGVKTLGSTRLRSGGSMISSRPVLAVHVVAGKLPSACMHPLCHHACPGCRNTLGRGRSCMQDFGSNVGKQVLGRSIELMQGREIAEQFRSTRLLLMPACLNRKLHT